ncbi:hypothetical protein [Pseudomonas sp. A2]|uniref:hypothetical protein n=1 Tax=Pseudomonas sp. A2 TaxID=107445 RepID=UPI001FFE3377|nr:hypothetical protein [Pseudomonas sp. A2]
MIGLPVPGSRAAILAQLNASIDGFGGGSAVQTLPKFEYVPHRPHYALEPVRASAGAQVSKRAAARMQRIGAI